MQEENTDSMDVPKPMEPCEDSASVQCVDGIFAPYVEDEFILANSFAMKMLNLTWEDNDCEDDNDLWKTTEHTTDIKPPESQLEAFRAQIPHQNRRAPFGVRRESYVKNFIIGVDFPHYSILTSKEQKEFLELSQKFQATNVVSSAQKQEFANFQATCKLVDKEQREYTTFSRKQSINFPINYEQMPLRSRRYIEKNLHTRQKTIPYQYPKLYHFYEKVPFGESIEKCRVEILPVQELKSLGTIPHFSNMIRSDNLKEQQVWLPVKLLELLERRYPSDDSISRDFLRSRRNHHTFLHHTPVSQDGNAQELAEMHEVDLVVSSSALQLMVDCHPNIPLQNCAFPRDLPITVRCYNDSQGQERKVVYIDKALPPVSMSAHEKKQWLCRRALRLLLCQQHKRCYSLEKKAEETKENEDEFEDKLKEFFQKCIDDEGGNMPDSEEADTRCSSMEMQKFLSMLFPCTFEAPPESTVCSESESDDDEDYDMDFLPKIPAPGNNVTYSLFTVRQERSTGDTDSRVRTGIKMLVRTSIHGYEWDRRRKQPRQIHTSLKLEHQPNLGAQMTSCSEITREWMALLIRPNTNLCRVRVDAESLRIIQAQHLTLQHLQAEAKARKMDLGEKLGALHHLLSRLMCLNKGHFLLKLEAREKTVTIIEEDTSGTNLRGGPMYHLHLGYKHSSAESGPTSLVPYSPIDTQIATPYHIENKLIPAMFPAADTMRKQNKKKANRNKKKKKLVAKMAPHKAGLKKQHSSSLHNKTQQKKTESSNNSEYSDASEIEVESVVKMVAKIDVEKPPLKSHIVESVSSQISVGKMLDTEIINIEDKTKQSHSPIGALKSAGSSEVFQFAAAPKVLDCKVSSVERNKVQHVTPVQSIHKLPQSTSPHIPGVTPKVLVKETFNKPTYPYQAKTNVDGPENSSLHHKLPQTVSMSRSNVRPKVLATKTASKSMNQHQAKSNVHPLSAATNISQMYSSDVKFKPLKTGVLSMPTSSETSIQGHKMTPISNKSLQKYKVAGSTAETQQYLSVKSEKHELPIQIKTEKFTEIKFVPAAEPDESIKNINVIFDNTPQIFGKPDNQTKTPMERQRAMGTNKKVDKTINVDNNHVTVKSESDHNLGKLKSIIVPETENLEPKPDSDAGGILEILNDPKTITSGRIPRTESVPIVPKVEAIKTHTSPPAYPLVYCDLTLSDDSDGDQNDSLPMMKRIYDSDLLSIETICEETVMAEPTLASVNVPAVPTVGEVRNIPNLGFTEPEISDGDFAAVIEEYGNPVELEGETVLDIDDLVF